MTPAALVLCGGQSRRMGQPKAWLPFGPERLLPRIVRLLGQVADPIVVVAAPDQEVPPLPGGVVLARDPVPGRGPLQGLATGLAALPDSVPLTYATATDAPFLEPDWVSRLVELIGEHDLAIPFLAGRHHPLAALYRPQTVRPRVQTLLAEDCLQALFLIDALRTRIVEPAEMLAVDPELKTLWNLNTPDDYRAALLKAGFEPA